MERTYIAPAPAQRDSIMYEAQIATPIYLRDNLVERTEATLERSAPATASATRWIVMPMFRLRQLRDSSAAVRTPSFMPSIYYEHHRLTAVQRDSATDSPTRELSHLHDVGLRIGWNHYSNGQAGCFRAGYVPPPSGDPDACVPGPNADTTGIGLNRANGDFSTTYWSGSGFYRRVKYGDFNVEKWALYGSYRGRGDIVLRGSVNCFDLRLELQGEIAEHSHPRIDNWRGHAELSARMPALAGLGAMVRVTGGQDYYNIGFVNSRSRVLFGVMLDPSRLETLTR
jgi:hypothetical protein